MCDVIFVVQNLASAHNFKLKVRGYSHNSVQMASTLKVGKLIKTENKVPSKWIHSAKAAEPYIRVPQG